MTEDEIPRRVVNESVPMDVATPYDPYWGDIIDYLKETDVLDDCAKVLSMDVRVTAADTVTVQNVKLLNHEEIVEIEES